MAVSKSVRLGVHHGKSSASNEESRLGTDRVTIIEERLMKLSAGSEVQLKRGRANQRKPKTLQLSEWSMRVAIMGMVVIHAEFKVFYGQQSENSSQVSTSLLTFKTVP